NRFLVISPGSTTAQLAWATRGRVVVRGAVDIDVTSTAMLEENREKAAMSGTALRDGRGRAEGEDGLGWGAEGVGAESRGGGRTGGEAKRDAERQEWSMHEVTTATGTTSRTLRHYDHIGLLPPARVGANGYRYYDAAGLLRLQRILLLRDL